MPDHVMRHPWSTPGHPLKAHQAAPNHDSLVKTRFEEVPAISHICALPYVGGVYGIETVYCTPARVRLF